MNMNALRKRPWLLVIAALVLFVAANVAMLMVALAHPAVLLR